MKNIPSKSEYKYFVPITTRWMDNDIYGHVNNVTYYSYFDTAANQYLIEKGGLDIHNAAIVGFVVASTCEYHSPISYPNKIEVGLRVERLGNSSVTYGLGIFNESEEKASANGTFTHVFVNRASNKSTPIPIEIKKVLELLE